MRVRIDVSAGSAELLDPEDMKAFDIELAGGSDVAAAARAAGLPRFEQHGWVPVALLRELAGEARTPEWDAQLDGLVGYARSKGWYDEEHAAVRGHVV